MAFEWHFDRVPWDHSCLLSKHACSLQLQSSSHLYKRDGHPVPMFWVGFLELAPKADGQLLS